MPWTIYCHTHIETGRRYIGLTARTMERRWSQHVTQSKSAKGGRWHFPNAIRKYGPEAFSHEILEIVATSLEDANVAEERWIEELQTRDPDNGFNLAKGGQHVPHPIRRNPWNRPEFREARLADLARANASITPEERSARSKELWSDPQFASKVVSATKAGMSTPESKEKRSRQQKAIKSTPEARAASSKASQELWSDGAHRAHVQELWSDHGFRERCSSGLRRGAALNASKTRCPHGHEMTPENTRVNGKGSRECLTCKRRWSRESARKRRQVATASSAET